MKTHRAIKTKASVGMLVLAIGAMPASADVELRNGGFTDGTGNNPDVWVENNLDLSCRQTWGSHDGDGYLMSLIGWAGGAGTYAEFHQDVTNVAAGNTYVLSFWQEGDSNWNGSDVTGRMFWLDVDSNVIGGVTTNLDAYTAGSVTWTRIQLAGVAPDGAVGVRVQFDATILASGGGGAAKFDDMTLVEYTGLLLNPGFAHGHPSTALDADFWTEHPTIEDVGRENWGSTDGDAYLMAIPAYKSGTYGAFYQDVTGVRPRYRYTLNFYVSGQDNYTGSNVFARLIWMNSALTPISAVSTNLDAQTRLWDWTPISLQGVSPDGASLLRVQLDAESAASGGDGAAKFDALTLAREVIPGIIIKLR